MEARLTKHASLRAAQRGVDAETVSRLIREAEVERPVGRGCSLLHFSREQVAYPEGQGKVGRYAVILSDDGYVVTVMPMRGSRFGRRYWRHR